MQRTWVSVAGLSLVAPLFAAAPTLAGPDWVERGDAGSLEDVAQSPIGQGSLSTIRGSLDSALLGADLADMYYIGISDPKTFKAELLNAEFDPHLWLFRIGSNGLLSNDDADEGVPFSRLLQFSTDGSEAFVDEPGDYLLAITGPDVDPISDSGPIFFFKSQTEISGPDGNGGSNPLVFWQSAGKPASGEYQMKFEGVSFPEIPSPGVATVLVLSTLAALRRRR